MRKALWSTAALIALLSGAIITWGTAARAATSDVKAGEGDAFKFTPAEISVPVGSTVRWENLSSVPHDAVAEGLFNSKRLQKGDKFEFTFTTPGKVNYICTEPGHEGAGMTGVINVTGGSTPAPTVASTTTTTAAAGGTTPTTAGGSTTTTTAKAAAGGSTTTTTAGAGVTSTTQAPSVTPTSAPETGDVTSTTAAQHAEAGAVEEHAGGESKEEEDDKSSPLGIAFAAVSTVLLVAISGKLLASKS